MVNQVELWVHLDPTNLNQSLCFLRDILNRRIPLGTDIGIWSRWTQMRMPPALTPSELNRQVPSWHNKASIGQITFWVYDSSHKYVRGQITLSDPKAAITTGWAYLLSYLHSNVSSVTI